ncbi:MAG: hypothetical protein Q9159_007198 [Coniocarpon cinnabarinum]
MQALRCVLEQNRTPLSICMFIDGLDEFEGHSEQLIQILSALSKQANVKVCVSSRPGRAFEDSWTGVPTIRLQDLTYNAIEEYVTRQLSGPIKQRLSEHWANEAQTHRLVTKIIERANGVFLWVVIATQEVGDGLRDVAEISELFRLIDTLPAELENLFVLMLRRIKAPFKNLARYRFRLLLLLSSFRSSMGLPDLCILHLMYTQYGFGNSPFSFRTMHAVEIAGACTTLRKKIPTHTAGLLELSPTPRRPSIYSQYDHLDPVLWQKTTFIHRTVKEFFLHNNDAKAFLLGNDMTDAELHVSVARGIFAQLAQFPTSHSEVPDDD